MNLEDACIQFAQAGIQYVAAKEGKPHPSHFKPFKDPRRAYDEAWGVWKKRTGKLPPQVVGDLGYGMLLFVTATAVLNGAPRPVFLASIERLFDRISAERMDGQAPQET